MVKLAANLTMMFNEFQFLDRFDEAAEAGFKYVEYLFPYPYKPEELANRLNQNDLKQVLFNFPAGDFSIGERGIATLPDRISEFRDGVYKAIEYSHVLDCKLINVLAGKQSDLQKPTEFYIETLKKNLEYAAQQCKKHGITVLLEALNTQDVPGYVVSNTKSARQIILDIGADNIKLQYDIYHMQIMEGNLAKTYLDNRDLISHIQLADNPGRHEPGTGEINYNFLLNYIYENGYNGYIGCEYVPISNTKSGLFWASKWL